MDWMILPLKRYARFRGRARRREFWMWVVFLVIAYAVFVTLDLALGLGRGSATRGTVNGTGFAAGAQFSGGILTGIFSLATFIPNVAVQVRRLHDTNHSGWWLLVPLFAYLGGLAAIFGGVFGGSPAFAIAGGVLIFVAGICGIVVFVFFCLDGTRGANRFGADPKGADLHDVFS